MKERIPIRPARMRSRGRGAALLLLAVLVVIPPVVAGLSSGAATWRGDVSRPVAIWPAGPLEVVAVFDRPVDRGLATALIGQTIPYREPHLKQPGAPPADRPDGALRIVGTKLLDEGRTLRLATDPHPRVARYRLQLGDVEATYDLSGVEAAWSEPGDLPPNWSGWWPSLDLETTRRLTRGSKPHEDGLALLARPGRLALSAWVRLPPGQATLVIDSSGSIEEAAFGDAQGSSRGSGGPGSVHRVELGVTSRGEPVFLTLVAETGAGGRPLALTVTYRMAGETKGQPVDPARLLLPWAPASGETAAVAPVAVPDLSGGDPERGRILFAGDQARCGQCHAFRGVGGKIGPDLTEIASKGRAEIYRSVAAPSAEIAPDFTTYTVASRDGRVVSGVVRAVGPDHIEVTDTNAQVTRVRRDEIQEIRPSATSIMPPGMAAALGDSALRDIIAYLTTPATAQKAR